MEQLRAGDGRDALKMDHTDANPPPRVLHCITHLALGGAERVALDLAQGLRPRFAAAVFAVQRTRPNAIGEAMRAELARDQTPLYPGTRVPLRWGGLIPAALSAARAVRRWKPDIIHLHTEIPEAALAAMFALRAASTGAALIRTIHNSEYWEHWPRLGGWCDRRLSHSYVAGVSRGAIAAFERLRLRSQGGLPPAPPTLIFNAIAVPSTVPARPAGNDRHLRLVFAGRFEPQKGADLLPEIAARVRLPAGITCELSLYGIGSLEDRLRAFAAAPPAGWTVKVCAPIAGLSRHLPEFDLVLMPSRFEGLSLVALEAMQLGVPLIATDAPGLCEQLPPDHPWRAPAGDAVEFARALHGAITSRSTWATVATRARAFVRTTFSTTAMFAGYERLYAEARRG